MARNVLCCAVMWSLWCGHYGVDWRCKLHCALRFTVTLPHLTLPLYLTLLSYLIQSSISYTVLRTYTVQYTLVHLSTP